MSSREIAELCEKQHGHVKRDIENMFKELELAPSNFGCTYYDKQNKKQNEYRLNKIHTQALVMKYNAKLRVKVLEYIDELEAKVQYKPLDYSDPQVVIGVVGALQDKVAEQRGTIEEQGQKLKKLDRIEGAQGLLSFREAAYTLNMGQKEFTDFLVSRRWIYKMPGNKSWMAYAHIRSKLYLEHVEHIYFNSLGEERVSTRAKVTPKGLVKISEMLEQPLN